MFKGSLVAIVTPMHDDGALDLEKFCELIDFHVAEKSDGIVVVGTTGESPTVDFEEHHLLIKTAVSHAAGRIPIIAGTGANSTREAIELTRFAKNAGAAACLSVVPYYNKPTQEGMYQHFKTIAEARLNFEDTIMLDLFGGTGNHSYEFISGGCTDVTYVDKFPGCISFVTKTAQELRIGQYIKIIKSDVFKFLLQNSRQYDYIFAGPPYPRPNLKTIPDEVFKYNALAPDGIFVLEHNPEHDFKQHPNYKEERNYGTTISSFVG